MDVLPTGSEFQVKRHGEDARFTGSSLRVPSNALRDRKSDVLQPRDLAAKHDSSRARVMIGPTYRADLWAALETQPALSAAALARATYGSFATAWHVRRDYGAFAGSAQQTRRRRSRG